MNAKKEFEKDFFKLMDNSVFGKTMENVRNHRDIKLVTTDKQRNKFASEPNYHSTKYILEDLLVMEIKKTEVKMNQLIYLSQAILDISKTLMYEIWCDYIKPKHEDKARLCHMDTDSFIINIKTQDFYEDISDDVEKWFDTSNYDKNDKRLLPIRINKKVLGMFKDELKGKIMTEFVSLRAKTYTHLIGGYNDEDYEKNNMINKKCKRTKKYVIKRELMFENYKESSFVVKVLLKSQLEVIIRGIYRRS